MALAATNHNDSTLVLANVSTGSVTQAIEASGTVAASTSTTASFATNGTVASVSVSLGQMVTKGQVLAALNTSSLQSAVDSANSTVASAQQRLQNDQNGETSTASGSGQSSGLTADAVSESLITSSSSSPSSTPTPSPSPTPSSTSSSTAAPTPSASSSTPTAPTAGAGSQSALITQIRAAQQKLIDAQKAVDTGQAAVDAAQAVIDADIAQNTHLSQAVTTACAATGSGQNSAECISATADYTVYANTLTTDGATLDTAISNQDAALSALDSAISELDTLLSQLSGSTAGSGGSIPSGGTGGQGSTGNKLPSTGSSGSGPAKTQTTKTASASQLAADQAAIDAAQAQLTVAQQNLAAATLTAPVAGQVATVGYTAGTSSNSKSITILGTGNQIVKINVGLSQIEEVKVGQAAKVTVDGQTKPIAGRVSKIGLLSTTSGSSTTFPVTVTLNDGSPAVHDGIGADVIVTTASASNAVLVPNSAISTVGTTHTVTVVSNGQPKTTRIKVGVVGTDMTQVTDGLQAGQQVEIADPSQPLPSSANSGSSTTGGIGNFQLPAGGSLPNFGNFTPPGN